MSSLSVLCWWGGISGDFVSSFVFGEIVSTFSSCFFVVVVFSVVAASVVLFCFGFFAPNFFPSISYALFRACS